MLGYNKEGEMNIFKKFRERSQRKTQKQSEKQRIRALIQHLCREQKYYDLEEQRRLLIDLDDVGIGFPGGF